MFFEGRCRNIRLVVVVVSLAIVLNAGCSIQGFVAKKVLTHVAKKAYHGLSDQNKKRKAAKARQKEQAKTKRTRAHEEEQPRDVEENPEHSDSTQ